MVSEAAVVIDRIITWTPEHVAYLIDPYKLRYVIEYYLGPALEKCCTEIESTYKDLY